MTMTMTTMLRSIAMPALRIRQLGLTIRSASSSAKRTTKVLPPSQPSGPVTIYTASSPTRPRLYLAAGISAVIFFTNAAFTVYDLLKVTVQVPTSQLDPSKSPDSLAGRIPQFIRKGTPLPDQVQSHLDENPPSPLRGWIAASGCLAVGAVCFSFGWRFARSWVHSITLVYPPTLAASSAKSASAAAAASAAAPVMAHITYGTVRQVVKQVPVAQCYTLRPVADMLKTDRPFIYIKKDGTSNKSAIVDADTHNQSLMLTMDSRGEFAKSASVYSVDRLFLQKEPIKSSSSPTVL